MKLQCSCGAKYAFDITPDMAQNPVRFVCPSCGLDSSDFVNELVRRELAGQFPDVAPSIPSAPPPPQPDVPVVPAASPLKISRGETTVPSSTEVTPVSKNCPKHHQVPATEKCAVCHKPICPKCMELFGYFCSVFCKSKAEAAKMNVPVYARQKFLVQRKFWRKTGLISGSIATAMILAFGFWIWYAWFGSVPHALFSVRFADYNRAYSGAAYLVNTDEVVFLHGGTLARYNLKTKQEVWSKQLVTQEQITDVVKQEDEERARERQAGETTRVPLPGTEEREAKIMLDGALKLYASGQNIWVSQPGELAHYDWENGSVSKTIPLSESGGELVERDGELQMLGTRSITHINLASGEMHTENFDGTGVTSLAAAQTTSNAGNNSATGGLPLSGGGNTEPLDPNKVAEQEQNLKLPARIALPALLANASYEQKLESALKDGDTQSSRHPDTVIPEQTGDFDLIPDQDGSVQFSTRLLQKNIVTREAMKAPKGKSALDSGNVGVMNETAAVNEQLNEMQRNSGSDTVTEDESRYQVTVHLPDSPGTADWTGEVIGPPQLFALKTVNVVAAGKIIIVLDKSNKKLWQAALTYDVPASNGDFGQASKFGGGPCVEQNGVLYVFDQAVLSAFDLATGNARWRVPSVGVVGLFFDEQGSVYVNTTTGNPDDIRYSRQIDVTKKTDDVLLKIDPVNGKILWRAKPGGFISYLSGKFIYTVESYDPNPTDEEVLNDTLADLQKPPYLRIARINPKNGQVMWEYYQDRAPFFVRFDRNTIELVFKREVQVLHYLTF